MLKPKIWIAPKVYRAARPMPNGLRSLEHVEQVLQHHPSLGRVFVRGAPGIRALSRVDRTTGAAATWVYAWLPLADAVPDVEDEVLVFDLIQGRAPGDLVLHERGLAEVHAEIASIWNALVRVD